MISPAYISEWSQQCPWVSPAQVEQDLVLSRGLVEIYSDPVLSERLLFRGGTALHKIVLQPAARYSEDLEFVQLHEELIGATSASLRFNLFFSISTFQRFIFYPIISPDGIGEKIAPIEKDSSKWSWLVIAWQNG